MQPGEVKVFLSTVSVRTLHHGKRVTVLEVHPHSYFVKVRCVDGTLLYALPSELYSEKPFENPL
jgi:hypothetical protein